MIENRKKTEGSVVVVAYVVLLTFMLCGACVGYIGHMLVSKHNQVCCDKNH